MSKIFEPLKRLGVIRRGTLSDRRIYELPFEQLLDLIDEKSSLTAYDQNKLPQGGAVHCASMPLGGGHGGCDWVGCRLERVDQLSRFAALYSDNVFFHNFLAEVSPTFGHPPNRDNFDFRFDITMDLRVMLKAEPLIEAELLTPYTTPRTYCPSCFVARTMNNPASRRVTAASSKLHRELLKELSVQLRIAEDGYCATVSRPKRVLEHDSLLMEIPDLPKGLKKNQRLVARLKSGQSVHASRSLVRQLELHKSLAYDIFNSTTYQLAVSQITGASFLTQREIDIQVLSLVSANRDLDRRNASLAQHFRAAVPFVGDVPIEKLVRLRRREADAFVRFRAALNRALNEILAQGEFLSSRTAHALYLDILAPELSHLEQRVKDAKRDLIQTPLTSAMGVTAVLGIGLFSGLLPTEMVPISKALGLGKVLYDTATKTMQLSDVRKTIRQEKFYYLWRVKHGARRKSRTHSIFGA